MIAAPSETYILPDLAWSCLLGPIMRDAKPGARLVVGTLAMLLVCMETLEQARRFDISIELRKQDPT